MDLKNLEKLAENKQSETKKFFKKLKGKKSNSVDEVFHDLHDWVFDHIDCLECANCCKTTSPELNQNDIRKMAKAANMTESDLIDKYLVVDTDQKYMFRESPCPFLLPDNYCLIYESRPRACREYPHTDRKKMQQILNLTLKNTFVCPAVFEIVEEMKKKQF